VTEEKFAKAQCEIAELDEASLNETLIAGPAIGDQSSLILGSLRSHQAIVVAASGEAFAKGSDDPFSAAVSHRWNWDLGICDYENPQGLRVILYFLRQLT
jgi:hypothetical protein